MSEAACIILLGDRGIKWLAKDAPIEEGNPLMFTCLVCQKTSGKYPFDPAEELHKKGCRSLLINSLGV